MRLSFRPLTFAIALSCAAGTAGAADLMEAYELARKSDPVLAAAESRSLAIGEVTRKSVSLYYYTAGRPDPAPAHDTIFVT